MVIFHNYVSLPKGNWYKIWGSRISGNAEERFISNAKKHMVLSVKKKGTKLPSYLGQTVLFPRVDS